MNKKSIAAILICLMLGSAAVLAGWKMMERAVRDLPKQPQHQDCEKVKTTCDRKKGCKCKLNCDHQGRRLPPADGTAECPSYCCEEKCECHPMGCS